MLRIQTRCIPTVANLIGLLLMLQAGVIHLIAGGARGGVIPTLALLIVGAVLASGGEKS